MQTYHFKHYAVFVAMLMAEAFWYIPLTSSQEIKLDSALVRDVVRGHQFLEQCTLSLSGKMDLYRDITNDSSGSSPVQFFFYRSGESLRLDYINPMEGTDVLPGDKRNDITKVVMRSRDNYDYHYSAVSTTGIPFSNLFKSKTPNADLQMRFQADFNQNINALTALPGGKAVDLLQRKIKSVVKRPYENITNALWFTGEEIDPDTGNSSTWTLVLNPDQHYALLFHKAVVTGKQSGNSIMASGKIVSQTMQDGKILPKEIILEGEMPGRKTEERSTITIGSTNEPDAKLFTEESFKELGRDIAIVDVLPNQKQMPGRIVEAAPLETRMPDYSAFPMEQGTNWSWTRILLLAIGVIMVIIACVMKLYNRRK